MKVLQVNVVYNNGSTGKVVADIHNSLISRNIEAIICYGRGEFLYQKGIYKTSFEIAAKINALKSRLTGLQYNGSFISTNYLLYIIKKEKPDIVHLHCLNGYFVNIYRLINFLKVNNTKTILTLHAEFMFTGSCGYSLDCTKWMNKSGCYQCPILWDATRSYFLDRTQIAWKNMKKAFDGFDNLIVTSVSPWLMNRASKSEILKFKNHITIQNGIDTANIFHPCEFDSLKKQHQISNEKIILHVTSNFESDIKGGKYIIELAKRLESEAIKIFIIGNRRKMNNLPINIIDVGRINDQKILAAYYSMADITVLTSKRETFSMVCAESLSCGTPIVGFKAGAPEQIALQEFSEFVEYGEIDLLEVTIRTWLDKKEHSKKEISEIASVYYSKEKMIEEYLNVYKSQEIF